MAGPSAELITVRVGFHVHREATMAKISLIAAALSSMSPMKMSARSPHSSADSSSRALMEGDYLPSGLAIKIRDPANNYHDVIVERGPPVKFTSTPMLYSMHAYVPSKDGQFCDVCGYGRNEALQHKVD